MADNSVLPVVGGNETFANKDVGPGVKYPRVLATWWSGTAIMDTGPANPLPVTATITGTIAATQSGAWTVTISGTPTVNQGGSWTVQASQTGTWNVGITGTAAVTQSGTWTVVQGAPGATAWKVDGSAVTQPISGTVGVTGTATIAGTVTANQGSPGATAWKVDPTAAIQMGGGPVTATTQRVALVDSQVAPLGLKTDPNSQSVVQAGYPYQIVAANSTAQILGTTGATGDYLLGLLIQPANATPGVVTVLDLSTTLFSFPGGSGSVSNFIPFPVGLGIYSKNGAWKITTGANVSVVAFGKFT